MVRAWHSSPVDSSLLMQRQTIGHSYFCNADECTDEWMQDVVDFDVLPMLAEYWFDDTDKLQRWENILHGVFQ